MNLIELIDQNLAYITLVQAILLVLVLILTIIMMIKQNKLKNKYIKFMQGASGKELESILIERFTDIDILKQASSSIYNEIDLINENLLSTVQKVGVVKYDAFNEMGGKLSFVLALLDKNNDGFIMNSVHSSREGCYTYLKEIIKGESFLELSKEEKNALNHAIKSDNFME
jgi:hypothetical protein